jgi:hypothetical protein
MLGAATASEASLLNGQSGEALGHGADTEITVTTRNALFVPGILGDTQRNMGALGVSLQTDTEGKLTRLPCGEEQIGMGIVALLGVKSEVDVTMTVEGILSGDFKNRLAGGKGIQSQKLDQLGLASGAVLVDGCHTVPAQGGGEGTGELYMVGKRKCIHEFASL